MAYSVITLELTPAAGIAPARSCAMTPSWLPPNDRLDRNPRLDQHRHRRGISDKSVLAGEADFLAVQFLQQMHGRCPGHHDLSADRLPRHSCDWPIRGGGMTWGENVVAIDKIEFAPRFRPGIVLRGFRRVPSSSVTPLLPPEVTQDRVPVLCGECGASLWPADAENTGNSAATATRKCFMVYPQRVGGKRSVYNQTWSSFHRP
jgi:hypothetical protein